MERAVSTLVLCLALLSPAKGVYAGDIEVVRAQVLAWGQAWQNRDIDRYMSFYSPVFRSKRLDYQGWQKQKAQAFKKAKNIRVEISDLWVFIEGQRATASFVQRYYDQNVLDISEKTLILVPANDTWKIVSEEWKPLKMPAQPTPKKTTVQNIVKLDAGAQKEPQHDQRAETKDLPMPAQPIQKKTAVRNHDDFDRSMPKVPQAEQRPEAEDLPPEENIVKSIKFQIKKDSEKVFIELNRFLIPIILTLEGDKPRIVIDIKNVSFWKGQSKIPVNGKLIQRIRTHLHRDIGKLRIVLDLNPADDYMIDQTFYRAENIYCIAVR